MGGEERKGYVVWISGENGKQGSPISTSESSQNCLTIANKWSDFEKNEINLETAENLIRSIETAFNRNLVRIYTTQYKWTDKTEFKSVSEKNTNRHL